MTAFWFRGVPTRKVTSALKWTQSRLGRESQGPRAWVKRGTGSGRYFLGDSWVLQPLEKGSVRSGQTRPSEAQGLG